MDATWCANVFRETVRRYGAPEILNTDQGSQFTSEVFTRAVTQEAGVKLSMDGKGRAIDNVFIERLWRSLKYEYLYLNPPADGLELYKGQKHWFNECFCISFAVFFKKYALLVHSFCLIFSPSTIQ